MLRKLVLTTAICLLSGFVFWVAVLPQFQNKTTKETIETIADNQSATTARKDAAETIRSGSFVGQNGRQASGKVRIIKIDGKKFVRLEEDFGVSNGPDLEIVFGNNSRVNKDSTVTNLKAAAGGQNYEIPKKIDENQYMELFIYSRSLDYSFAIATISQQ